MNKAVTEQETKVNLGAPTLKEDYPTFTECLSIAQRGWEKDTATPETVLLSLQKSLEADKRLREAKADAYGIAIFATGELINWGP